MQSLSDQLRRLSKG
ncbi:hypothetical protein OFN42_43620 [Escherichia coli]|nr:hypothetical protein [Escherichia coli]